MMQYYCEVEDKWMPYFANYTYDAKTPKEAVNFFKQKFGKKLELVYDANFKNHYERKTN
jgi:hypothetical protein